MSAKPFSRFVNRLANGAPRVFRVFKMTTYNNKAEKYCCNKCLGGCSVLLCH